MADITSGVTNQEQSPRMENKVVVFETADTADTGDTFDVTLSDYGLDTTVGVLGFDITNNTQEQPTWSVSSGTLTITLGGSTNSNAARRFIVYG